MNTDDINEVLKTRYGTNLREQPKFRIVSSDSQFEKRFGVYNEFYGKIFIRQFKGLKEVPKYPYIKNKWVLERWMPPEVAYTRDIPETSEGSYEPLFVFQDEYENPLEIWEEAVHKLISVCLNPQLYGDRKSNLKEEDKKEFNKDAREIEDEITEQGRTWIGHRLQSGEGIVKP